MADRVALALLAHPDDIEFLCAGTLVRLKELGWRVHLATMTAGDCGSAEHGPEDISTIRTAEARASDVVEHTAELGGFAQLGNISSFGVDADGELYIVNHSGGRIIRLTAPLTAPSTTTGLTIFNP